MEWLLTIGYLIALLATSVASIFWGKKFQRASDKLVEAKDAHISRLESDIKNLERLSPPVLRDWVEASQRLAQEQVDVAKRNLEVVSRENEELRVQGTVREESLLKEFRRREVQMLWEQSEMLSKESQRLLRDFQSLSPSASPSVSPSVSPSASASPSTRSTFEKSFSWSCAQTND